MAISLPIPYPLIPHWRESMNWTSFLLGVGAMSAITTAALVWIAVRGNKNKSAAYIEGVMCPASFPKMPDSLNALAEALGNSDEQTPNEIRQELRDEGVDVDAADGRTAVLLKSLKAAD